MEIANVALKYVPREFDFVITVFYVNSEEEEKRR